MAYYVSKVGYFKKPFIFVGESSNLLEQEKSSFLVGVLDIKQKFNPPYMYINIF